MLWVWSAKTLLFTCSHTMHTLLSHASICVCMYISYFNENTYETRYHTNNNVVCGFVRIYIHIYKMLDYMRVLPYANSHHSQMPEINSTYGRKRIIHMLKIKWFNKNIKINTLYWVTRVYMNIYTISKSKYHTF